jgi:hypothetical protein
MLSFLVPVSAWILVFVLQVFLRSSRQFWDGTPHEPTTASCPALSVSLPYNHSTLCRLSYRHFVIHNCFSSAVPIKTPPAQKLPKKAPKVQIKQESSSEEESSEEDESKANIAKAPCKSRVKTPAKPAVQVKQEESSSEDSDDSKCDRFACK